MLTTRDIPNVEILSVGTWHGTGCPPAGCAFTEADLDSIADAYAKTKDVLRPPAKLGHDDNQKLLQADGYPAAGWLSNVRRVGQKLLADVLSVPNKLAELIDAGAYRTRSVELEGDYEVAGTKYPMVLTGMAWLGADLPAVESLADIAGLYASRKLSLPNKTRAIVFTTPPRGATFALPDGMSYDDLSARIRVAFTDQMPGADADDCWVSDLYADAAIINLEGRYWKQPYTVSANGEVTLSGLPAEVQRVTEWQAVVASRNQNRSSYADNADRVLADVTAFTDRTGQLVALRAKDGRQISEKHQARLTSLRDGLRDAEAKLGAFLEPEPEPEQDFARVMRARLRAAELRAREIAGATA